jgi:hypothetical protein
MKFSIKSFLILSLTLISFIVLSGCATLFKGSTEPVNFSSDPSGAKVYVNGSLLGTTPFSLELKSKQNYTIEFRKEGYETKTVLLNNSVGAGWVILDILGGLIPIIIDAATGNWYTLDQENINAYLETAAAKEKE